MNVKKINKGQRIALTIVILICFIWAMNFFVQKFWAHRDGCFTPDYDKVTLTKDSDYETIFLQTGLGKAAVDKLLEEDDFEAILEAQEAFFSNPEASCNALVGWFTREDRLTEGAVQEFVDLQPGDILVTLSTHSIGWRHGHAAIVIGGNTTLESAVIGENSDLGSIDKWKDYSNFAVLRIKDVTEEEQIKMVQYALAELRGVPYHLTSGFIGPKDADTNAAYFGTHCTYLVWYAWNHFGYDTDSDGGRLVSSYDLLHSDAFEIVQVYGMDPREFIK